MILVFAIDNGNTRIISGVTKVYEFGESFVFNREGHKQPKDSPKKLDFGMAFNIDFLLCRYKAIYVICDLDNCATLGVGDGLIKWIAWNGEFIAHMNEQEAHEFIKENPL